ncbi:Imm1 family immunity protein [Actinokineospora iranica]|uniref:Immunity protein Imm1 n=1 Tax=Actinokineospora iranica TaxID=1271860 RepID=A0A1G6X322_9PSEU|nr:Imm1 family immunity protein [Actinokineospora iranica]SDD72444.1 Immunity protein Imm1 [Actinokineospora iranica]
MTDHIVTGHGGYSADPFIVATHEAQRRALVDAMLRDPGLDGVDARNHSTAFFYVADRPMWIVDGPPVRRWLRVGFYYKFGGAVFVDETVPDGADWSWAALRPNPIEDPPPIYYDQETDTWFPPASVMPLRELHDVVLEWVDTGKRPTSVDWMPINRTAWSLDGNGQIACG